MANQFIQGAASVGHPKIGIASPPNEPGHRDITVFFGLSQPTIRAWREIQKHKQPFVYIDNCYMGKPKAHFRITPHAITAQTVKQHPGMNSGGRRFEALNIHPKPWRRDGDHILLCLQSELYFKLVVGEARSQWIENVCAELQKYTDRTIIVRDKPNKVRPQPTLEEHLDRCHMVVTWNSTTAVKALINGIPAICLDPQNSFRSVCFTGLKDIENPIRVEGRKELLHWLADNQWTADEIRDGTCWSAIRGYL